MNDFWERLWYIKVDAETKRPIESGWGFNEEAPFGKRDTVYGFNEVNPAINYAYLAHQDRVLGVLDLDVYKEEAPDNLGEIKVPSNPLVIRSPSGGVHIPFFVAEDCAVRVNPEYSDWIDLKGELGSGYVIAPQSGTSYEITNEAEPVTVDPSTDDWVDVFSYDNSPLLVEEPKQKTATRDHDSEPVAREGSSALWELTLTDVAPVSAGERCNNPLGHHGDSEGYYVVAEDGETAYDFKYDVTYNGLVYVLCEAGVRPASDPEGQLSDYEKFQAWKHAKEKGYIAEDDEVPYSALCGVANKRGLVDETDDGLSGSVYYEAIDFIETECGLETGRTPEPYGVVSTGTPDVWRDRRDEITIPKREVHSRVEGTIIHAIRSNGATLVDSIPSTGKSRSSTKAVAECVHRTPATILTGRGRKEMYEKYASWAESEGLSSWRLASRDDCPTFREEHGDSWKQTVEQLANLGVSISEIHRRLEPPCTHDRCDYMARCDFDPMDYDVLIGHYVHAHLYPAVSGRAVIIDEFPDQAFEVALGPELPTMVSNYLDAVGLPDVGWTEFMERRDDKHLKRRLSSEFMDPDGMMTIEPKPSLAYDGIHAATPIAVASLLYGEDLGNGWETWSFETVRAA